jgi:hypothetical protein
MLICLRYMRKLCYAKFNYLNNSQFSCFFFSLSQPIKFFKNKLKIMCKTSHFFTRVNVGPLCSVFTYHVRCIIRVRNYVLSNNSRLPIFCFKLIAGFDPTATGFGLRACLLCWTLTSCLLPLSGFPARARPLPTRSGPNAPAKSRSVRFSFEIVF